MHALLDFFLLIQISKEVEIRRPHLDIRKNTGAMPGHLNTGMHEHGSRDKLLESFSKSHSAVVYTAKQTT